MTKGQLGLSVYYYSGNAHVKNRFLDEKKREIHVERLDSMKAAIDNKCPKSFLQRTDAKRQKAIQERQHKIDRENKILLDKLARILNRKPFVVSSAVKRRPTNPYEERREKESKRVDAENSLLVLRIHQMTLKSAYDRNRFLKERTENEMYIKRLSHYPTLNRTTSTTTTRPSSSAILGRMSSSQQQANPKRVQSAPSRKPASIPTTRAKSAPTKRHAHVQEVHEEEELYLEIDKEDPETDDQ